MNQVQQQTLDAVILQKFSYAAESQGISEREEEEEEKNKTTVKILPSHHRVTKQATWEPELWEYRTSDLGDIRLMRPFFVYMCV